MKGAVLNLDWAVSELVPERVIRVTVMVDGYCEKQNSKDLSCGLISKTDTAERLTDETTDYVLLVRHLIAI